MDLHPFVPFSTIREIESWQPLVHVCRRWRCLVFGSPHRLNLQVCCYQPRRLAKKCLDAWPALPLVILGNVWCPWGMSESVESVDHVIAELKHSDRICQINLRLQRSSQIEKLRTVMQVPFPELARLCLSSRDLSSFTNLNQLVFPDSFLGGSAPRLRYIYLNAIPFPGLPKLLLSATHLVKLTLYGIPRAGYISPETMATCLSMLTRLENLQFKFDSRQSYPDLKSRRPFPPTRSVLPTLTSFCFKGVSEYSEEFMARIDAPQLDQLLITFCNDIDFKAPELNQFISRTPKLGAYDMAHVSFDRHHAQVVLRPKPFAYDHRIVRVKISPVSDPQLYSPLLTLAEILTYQRHFLYVSQE